MLIILSSSEGSARPFFYFVPFHSFPLHTPISLPALPSPTPFAPSLMFKICHSTRIDPGEVLFLIYVSIFNIHERFVLKTHSVSCFALKITP